MRSFVGTMVLVLALAVAGCDGDEPPRDDHVGAASTLLGVLGVDVVDPPSVVESKAVRYVTAAGTRPGDTRAVVDGLSQALTRDGWAPRPADPAPGQAAGNVVVADKDGLVVMLAVFPRIGTRQAPPGAVWVQLSLAEPDDRLDWTKR